MTQQQKLDAIMAKAAREYRGINADLQNFAITEIQRTRLDMIDLLNEYAKKDDTISKARLSSLLRDVEQIEKAIRENGMKAMEEVAKQSAAAGTLAGEMALVGALGETAAAGYAFNRMNTAVFQYVVNRFGEDGLVLSDRVWQLAGDQREQLNRVIRNGIIRGESVGTMVAQVRRVYDAETWKIRRLVVTEGNVAYRTGSAYRAQRSKHVKGLRIHRGKANRPEHRCTQLEQIDRYGLGAGVYLPDDIEVLNPHVNCTSFTTYVLIDKEVR
jgi:hypothetical protein